MGRRQTLPERWFVVTGAQSIAAVRHLPRGTGLLVLPAMSRRSRDHLHRAARANGLHVVEETRGRTFRVHDSRELRHALARSAPLVFISPIHPTRSHPDWQPLPRMRAAALARLAKGKAVALGGMDARRYAKIAPLGFIGWAGISAFRT